MEEWDGLCDVLDGLLCRGDGEVACEGDERSRW